MATTRLPYLDLPRAANARGTVALPGSKSISNRVLLLAALAQGRTEVRDLLASHDTAVMRDSLVKLGVTIEGADAGALVVQGVDGRFAVRAGGPEIELFVGNSGLTIRTLVPAIAASLAATGGTVRLSGVPRMHERPIGDLVGGLEQLGARVRYLGTPGYPPLAIEGTPLRSGVVRVKGDTSSQYLTGLLQAAPLIATTSALVIEVVGELISKPYIEITLNLMARFGVSAEREGWSRFTVAPGQHYTSPGTIAVEGDASSASYFLAAGAIGGGPVRVTGAGRGSIQGDVRFAEALAQMGARIAWGDDWIEASAEAPLQGIDLDCNHIPDAAMTLAVCALQAQGTTRLRNIGSWRVKETDRLAAMATELRKLGATVGEGPDWITIDPPERLLPAQIATYDDHRMAMCFSLAALDGRLRAGAEVRLFDPDCVAKTFPDYFERFAALTGSRTAIPVIAIDGPTASGKGTVAARVAQALGLHLLDSGALYRLTGLAAIDAGVSPDDGPGLGRIAAALDARFDEDGCIWHAGREVSTQIRAEAAGNMASRVAVHPEVRRALVERQRAFRQPPGLVADGRDMGTVIFPDAPLKVYLTASIEARAQRRHKQLIEKGFPANLAALSADLRARDERDTQRADAPLKPAEDAHLLDTSDCTVDEAVAQVLAWWQACRSRS